MTVNPKPLYENRPVNSEHPLPVSELIERGRVDLGRALPGSGLKSATGDGRRESDGVNASRHPAPLSVIGRGRIVGVCWYPNPRRCRLSCRKRVTSPSRRVTFRASDTDRSCIVNLSLDGEGASRHLALW